MESECPICYSIVEVHNSQSLSCGCLSCISCLTNWTVTKIQELRAGYDSYIPCPCCITNIQIKEIVAVLTPEYRKIINEALFEVYLIKENDIRKCPNSKCLYAGVITTSLCRKRTECPSCQLRWKEVQHYTSVENFFEHNVEYIIKDLSSSLEKRLRTKRCRVCKTRIEKNGGCNHITCSQCKYEFCWVCSCRYPKHNELMHGFHSVIKPPLLILLKFFLIFAIANILYSIPPIKFMAKWTVIPVSKSLLKSVWRFAIVIMPWIFSFVGSFLLCNIGIFCAVRLFLGQLMSFKDKLRFGSTLLFCLGLSYFLNIGWIVLAIGLSECVLFGFANLIWN